MGVELEQTLYRYRDITVKLIEVLKKEDYDSLESFLAQRQVQIDAIDKILHTKQEFSDICKELEILVLQEELTKLMAEKRAAVKSDLSNFNKGKSANMSYRKKGSIDSIYFNKKI